MNIILIVLGCVVVRIIYKTTMTTLEQQQPDEARIAEAQREHANEYRAFERRERERAMRK